MWVGMDGPMMDEHKEKGDKKKQKVISPAPKPGAMPPTIPGPKPMGFIIAFACGSIALQGEKQGHGESV